MHDDSSNTSLSGNGGAVLPSPIGRTYSPASSLDIHSLDNLTGASDLSLSAARRSPSRRNLNSETVIAISRSLSLSNQGLTSSGEFVRNCSLSGTSEDLTSDGPVALTLAIQTTDPTLSSNFQVPVCVADQESTDSLYGQADQVWPSDTSAGQRSVLVEDRPMSTNSFPNLSVHFIDIYRVNTVTLEYQHVPMSSSSGTEISYIDNLTFSWTSSSNNDCHQSQCARIYDIRSFRSEAGNSSSSSLSVLRHPIYLYPSRVFHLGKKI